MYNTIAAKYASSKSPPWKVARLLHPAIDHIWQEFGLDGSLNYGDDGTYLNRSVFLSQ